MTIKEMLAHESKASYVEYGYGQVEPNHLSAQRTGQIYAQLPTADGIKLLENGQFVKYDYAHGEVNFTGDGEWMLVFNEIKLYRDEPDCAFAMKQGDYLHRIYSPSNGGTEKNAQSRYYGIKGYKEDAETKIYAYTETDNDGKIVNNPTFGELDAEGNPFKIYGSYDAQKMANKYAMIPRVVKTNIGDIITTNTINADETLKAGDMLTVNESNGILTQAEAADDKMTWQVAKVYTMPDGQKGVKIIRIV